MSYPVFFDASCEPEAVTARLVESLRIRRMNPQFHYTTLRQAGRWLELHDLYSPSRNNAECEMLYENAFKSAASVVTGCSVQAIGLGCGGGRKDSRLTGQLRSTAAELRYTAVDVSPSLVLTARKEVLQAVPDLAVRGLVTDLMESRDLEAFWASGETESELRIFSLLGMLPNLPSQGVLEKVGSWMRKGDILIVSANLAPGDDYAAGCKKVLPLYDNVQTRRWLQTVWDDLDVPADAYGMYFEIGEESGLKRVEAWIRFTKPVVISYGNETFSYEPGGEFLLFHSNRHTASLMRGYLEKAGLEIATEWMLESGEEGVWVLRKRA